MTSFRTILVPTDFSAHSAKALATATELAKVFGSKLHLLHSYSYWLPMQGGATPYGFTLPGSVWEGVRDASGRKLEELREKTAAEGLEVEAHLTQALPSEAIASTAETLGVDLIVIGTRGNRGLKHVLLGSVASRTIRIAPCPVLTVKGDGD